MFNHRNLFSKISCLHVCSCFTSLLACVFLVLGIVIDAHCSLCFEIILAKADKEYKAIHKEYEKAHKNMKQDHKGMKKLTRI